MNKGKEVIHDSGTMGVVKLIIRELSNNAHKIHLWAIMAIENKKLRPNNLDKSFIISFFDEDYLKGFSKDHDDLMVIITTIHNYVIKRILVDQQSLTSILF